MLACENMVYSRNAKHCTMKADFTRVAMALDNKLGEVVTTEHL